MAARRRIVSARYLHTPACWPLALPVLLILLVIETAIGASAAITGNPTLSMRSLVNARIFEEPLVPTTDSSPDDDETLSLAIAAYQKRKAPDDFNDLESYLSRNPHSPWRLALLTNLGLDYYHYGYFSKAISAWEQAWKEGRSVTALPAKFLVDRAVGELARMHARLGHADRIATLIDEIGDRPLSGAATEAVTGAKEGLWTMRNQPGVAFLCGPKALENLLLFNKVNRDKLRFIDEYQSGPNGVSLREVSRLAAQADLHHRLVYRDGAQNVPMPSIVHWNVSHFAVLLGEAGGRIHIKDPTFGQDLWITQKAFELESSGYFLLPSETVPKGFREITAAEAEQVRGMGFVNSIDDGETQPTNTTTHPKDSCSGMCTYNIIEPAVSLNLKDTPVGYNPPRGPSAKVSIIYNQREAGQPANFSFFNVSPKWTINWLTYVQDDPTFPGASVTRYVGGGGLETYFGYDDKSGSFAREANTKSGALLIRSLHDPIRYDRLLQDGTREVYAQSDSSTSFPRRVFLSSIVDPQGNVLTLNYDSQQRLLSLTDATGRNTNFSYGLQNNPLLITQITDPFGRSAKLRYDSNGHLIQITDVLGLSSAFNYDTSGLVTSMTTPYGTTNFLFGESTFFGPFRFIEITDPKGASERVEFLQGAPGIPFSESPTPVGIGVFDCCSGFPHGAFLDGRNTFFWDKSVLPIARGDYTKAVIHHFMHDTVTNFASVAGVLESIKYPLERRVWFNYHGQPLGGTGDQDLPSAIGRVLDDGTTQLTTISYNDFEKPTQITDPVGRITAFTYSSDGIDLLRISQQTAPGVFSQIAGATYNNQHRPLSVTDAAGQSTRYSYNSAGQLASATDPLGHTTTYIYDTLGRLLRINNANNIVAASFTYDTFDRVATFTDSEGYILQFRYDPMDRITSILYPDGTTRQFTWSKLDLASVTDRLGRSTQYTYDAVRNLVDVGDPIHRHTTFSYYANKHLKSVRDPDGNTTSWNIDIQSRVTAKQYADGREWITTYEDTASRVKSVGDPSGQVTQYSYAVDDGLSGINYSNAINPTPTVSFSYDPYFRRLVSMSDESGTTQYQYVPVGTLGALKVRSESGPFLNSTIGYQYDALGRILTREVDASRETFAYDKLGRMVNHSGPLGIFTFEYLGQTQQMISRMLGSGSVQTHWMYGTNANDRRLRYINNGAAARNFGFNTNSESLITTLNQTGVTSPQSWTYSYDASNRLLSGKSSLGPQFSYSYDAADNLLTAQSPSGNVNASYNNVNQVINFGTSVFVYDVNGNLTSDGVRTYQWDAANRLVDIGINNVPGSHVSIKYDGIGRRIGLIMSNGAGAAEKRYLWCGGALCQARNSSDVVIRRYYPEGELSSDGPQYYSQDQLGSIRDVLNGMTGYSISAFDYDPYGNPTETRGHSLTDFRYAGLFFEQNSGLYLARHRVYDPKSTRWLSRDPLAEAASGINLYEYVNQNPINGVDTTGLQSWLDSLYAWLSGPAKEPIKPTDIGGEAMNMVPSTVAIAATVANIQTERRAYERYLDAIGTDQQDAALAAWNQTKTNLRTAEQAMQLSNEIPGNPSWLDALELWYKGLMDKLGCSQ